MKLIFRSQSEDNIEKDNIEKPNSDSYMNKATDEREIFRKNKIIGLKITFDICEFFEYMLVIVVLKA